LTNVSIATNNSYRDIAINRGSMEPEDVFVVRSGPDLNRLTVSEPDPKWNNGRKNMVGYLGVMGDQEGIDLLLEAAQKIVFDHKRDVQFVLVGGGPALDDLKKMSTGLGLDNHVTFTGRAPDEELFSVLSSADVCVNPDRVNPMNDSSTMNKILEYMAFSKPIVQFEVREGRYSAQEASLYAEPNNTDDLADKILSLIDDPAKRAQMGTYGRNRVETELSWDHQVDTLVKAYLRVEDKK